MISCIFTLGLADLLFDSYGLLLDAQKLVLSVICADKGKRLSLDALGFDHVFTLIAQLINHTHTHGEEKCTAGARTIRINIDSASVPLHNLLHNG